jgi:hypothetical protein
MGWSLFAEPGITANWEPGLHTKEFPGANLPASIRARSLERGKSCALVPQVGRPTQSAILRPRSFLVWCLAKIK